VPDKGLPFMVRQAHHERFARCFTGYPFALTVSKDNASGCRNLASKMGEK